MSNFGICKLCGEYASLDRHECPPIYYFKHEDWGDEFQAIRARSFEGAAREFARRLNENGDYVLMDNEEEVIISDGKEERLFVVSAEQVIDYIVRQKE